MSYLDEKTYAIIEELSKSTYPITISELAVRIGVSRRAIYYHLDKINDVLKSAKYNIVSNKQREGLQIDENQKMYLKSVAKAEKLSYILNTEERQLLLMFYIAITANRVTLNQLMAISDTSRNTTLNDIVAIREYLLESVHHITLEVDKRNGYYFSGKVVPMIEFMYALVTQIFQSSNVPFVTLIKNMIVENNTSSVLLSDDFKNSLYHSTQQVENELGKHFIEKDLRHMVDIFPYLILALKTIPSDNVEKDLEEVFVRLEYRSAMSVLTSLSQQYQITFSVSDVYIATLMLLSSRKSEDSHVNSSDYKKLAQTLTLFIDEFENQTGVVFESKGELLQRLLMHFKVLIYRKKYNIFTKNLLKDSIKEKYKELFTIVKLCSYMLEDRLHIQLNEDDIAYLTIHFGGAMRYEHKRVRIHRIVILTDEGVGIQKLLVKQCKKYITQLNIVAVVSRIEDIPKNILIDFVVTTMTNIHICMPFVSVNAIFQAHDIINLLKMSSGTFGANTQEELGERLKQILSQYISNHNHLNEASVSIQKLLNEQLVLGYDMPTEKILLQYLSNDRIFIRDYIDNIEHAVEILSQPMLQKGTITQNYIQKILEDVHKKRLYMSIYPEVLLLHSHYIPQKTKTDVSMLYIKTPVKIDDKDYRLFILLSTEETMAHLPVIADIDSLLQSQLMAKLRKEATQEKLMSIMMTRLTDEKLNL